MEYQDSWWRYGGGGVGGCGVVVACVKGACVKEEKEIWCVLPNKYTRVYA